MTVYTYKTLSLYDNDSGKTITLTEDPDGLGMVHVKCDSDYYGKLDFNLADDMALALANAIIEQLKYIKEDHGNN